MTKDEKYKLKAKLVVEYGHIGGYQKLSEITCLPVGTLRRVLLTGNALESTWNKISNYFYKKERGHGRKK